MMMSNVVAQHYATWLKNDAKEIGNSRLDTLLRHGFKGTPYTVTKDEHGSPIEYAKKQAQKMLDSGEFDCDSVHIVLLDGKNMDGNTGYRLYRKLIKAS